MIRDDRGPSSTLLRWPWKTPGSGGRTKVSAAWLARVERIAALAEAMSWPSEEETARLDGALRLAAAPILADLVTDVARLKALVAGLVSAPSRPVELDRDGAGDGPGAAVGVAEFRPGRFVAVSGSGDRTVAATDPFSGLARRVLDLLLPEMEQALAELTVLFHEQVWNQEFELVELLEGLPVEALGALEAARPGWRDDEERRVAELARRRRHLEGWIDRGGEGGGVGAGEEDEGAIADLRRALVRAVGLAGRGERAGAGRQAASAAAEAAAGRLRELIAALEGDGGSGPSGGAAGGGDGEAWAR